MIQQRLFTICGPPSKINTTTHVHLSKNNSSSVQTTLYYTLYTDSALHNYGITYKS